MVVRPLSTHADIPKLSKSSCPSRNLGALFVAPVLVLLSYVIGPTPLDLRLWPGAVVMMLLATLTAALVMNGGRSACSSACWCSSSIRSSP